LVTWVQTVGTVLPVMRLSAGQSRMIGAPVVLLAPWPFVYHCQRPSHSVSWPAASASMCVCSSISSVSGGIP
jgi:hypothetical protein